MVLDQLQLGKPPIGVVSHVDAPTNFGADLGHGTPSPPFRKYECKMHAEELAPLNAALFDSLQSDLPDAPSDPSEGIQEVQRFREPQRPQKPPRPLSPLQLRYQRQIKERQVNRDLVERMSRMVAWTWVAGRNRRHCPGVVDMRDVRLLTIDRSPSGPGRVGDRMTLCLHRTTYQRQTGVVYAGPFNLEMVKDLLIAPRPDAGGLVLDARNEEIFSQALAADYATELVARGLLEPVKSFEPPQVLVGFPNDYVPSPEWTPAMHDALVQVLHPDAPTLRCLLSPGGHVTAVSEKAGFRIIDLERHGNTINVRMPIWTTLNSAVRVGQLVPEGQPLADVPRIEATRMKDITGRFSYPTLEWLENRILDELTEIVTVSETVYDKQSARHKEAETTWRCVPLPFVTSQVGRAFRMFLDLREYLGRPVYSETASDNDPFDVDERQARIDVVVMDRQPKTADLDFGDGFHWSASILEFPPRDPLWNKRFRMRGK